ncbi:adenine phosphoribosyltransferase [bacterium]|nr:adenine phosphoribosyltransferase [bacterium]
MEAIEDKILKIFLADLKEYPPLSRDKERKLFDEYIKTKSSTIRKKIMMYNQRLVVNIAKKYFRHNRSKLDIISEGNEGLMKAIDHFQPELGFKFSTYAYWWIDTTVKNFVANHQNIVHTPSYLIHMRIKLVIFERQYYQKHRRKPSIKEIAKYFKMSENEFSKKLETLHSEYSMDFKLADNGNEFITVFDNTDYLEEVNKKYREERLELIKTFLKKLKPAYATAMSLRFGIDNQGTRTLEEIGNIMHLSKERIRQLLKRGIEIIKSEYFKQKELIMSDLKGLIRDVPDFPKEGIIFKDITTLLKDVGGFKTAIDAMQDAVKDLKFDKIAVIESRGFIFGSVLSYLMEKPLVLVRKKGKLPADKIAITYDLEYGSDTLEMHKDSIKEGDKFLIVDDLLATGGTVKAVVDLIKQNHAQTVGALFLIELKFLKARKILDNLTIFNIIEY